MRKLFWVLLGVALIFGFFLLVVVKAEPASTSTAISSPSVIQKTPIKMELPNPAFGIPTRYLIKVDYKIFHLYFYAIYADDTKVLLLETDQITLPLSGKDSYLPLVGRIQQIVHYPTWYPTPWVQTARNIPAVVPWKPGGNHPLGDWAIYISYDAREDLSGRILLHEIPKIKESKIGQRDSLGCVRIRKLEMEFIVGIINESVEKKITPIDVELI